MIKLGFFTKRGMVFVTSGYIVHKDKIVAEPDELINVEGDVCSNYSRMVEGDPDYKFPADVVLVHPYFELQAA